MTVRKTTKIIVGTGRQNAAAVPSAFTNPETPPTLVANHIARDTGLDVQTVSEAIVDITPETQTLGPALLQVQIIDPQWIIQRALPLDADGFLPIVDVNYPEGSPVWWRLAMVDGGSDIASANVTLTFQHRIWNYLTLCSGPLTWPPNNPGSTRAQFGKMVLDKMPSELLPTAVGATGANGLGGPADFVFVCPDLNVVQPVAAGTGQTVLLSTQADAAASAINQTPGVTNATAITIKGAKPNAAQIANINTVMAAATLLKAPRLAAVALIEACIQESTMTNLPKGDSTSKGILQFLSTPDGHRTIGDTTIDVLNVEASAIAFLTMNYYTQPGWNYGKPPGGAIASAKANPTASADQIAQAAQGSAHPSAYGQWQDEASSIVDAHGGLVDSSGSSTSTTESDVSQLARGSTDDPDEDSATCLQRLASEVNWRCYTNPQPFPGFWGNYVYFVDDTTMVKSTPGLYLKLDDAGQFWQVANADGKFLGASGDSMITGLTYTVDDTSIQAQHLNTAKAQKGGIKKKKVARKTAVRKPQTPTQVQCNLITGGLGILGFNAGMVVVVQNTGIIDGRWILENNTTNTMSDLFQQLTLGPPEFAYPEPQASSTGAGDTIDPASTATANTGALSGVADAARMALAKQTANKNAYHYQEIAGQPVPASLFSNDPLTMDCSMFAELCYRAAGLSDPNHYGYKSRGNTSSLIAHCKQVSATDALPGDMCFFGSSLVATTHVNIYVGNGQSISMGQNGDPDIGPSADMGPGASTFLGYFRSDVAPKTASGSGSGSGTLSTSPAAGASSPFASLFSDREPWDS